MLFKKKPKSVVVYVPESRIHEYYANVQKFIETRTKPNGAQDIQAELMFWNWVKRDLLGIRIRVKEIKWGGSITDPFIEYVPVEPEK
jgi:hypothetical protein